MDEASVATHVKSMQLDLTVFPTCLLFIIIKLKLEEDLVVKLFNELYENGKRIHLDPCNGARNDSASHQQHPTQQFQGKCNRRGPLRVCGNVLVMHVVLIDTLHHDDALAGNIETGAGSAHFQGLLDTNRGCEQRLCNVYRSQSLHDPFQHYQFSDTVRAKSHVLLLCHSP